MDQVGGLKEVHVEDKDKVVSSELGFEEILNNVISITPATEQER